MLKMLVDTCVWLDMAKTPSQAKNIELLMTLRAEQMVDVIVPQIVLDEFLRNRDRVIGEYVKSITTTMSRAKEIIAQQRKGRRSKVLDRLLDQANSQILTPRAVAERAADQIESLMQAGDIVDTTDDMKLAASARAIEKRAPFHRDKNSFNDELIIEAYGAYIKKMGKARDRFAFVTHNHRDFSEPNGNQKIPHPDLASFFSPRKSRYYISVGDALGNMHLQGPAAWMFDTYDPPIRSATDIGAAIDEFIDKVWYNRHKVREEAIDSGRIKIVEKENFPTPPGTVRPIQRDIWEGALKAAKKVEKRYGLKNVGPWDNFEWGMLNGKLSALRWVLGDEWDMLDT
jgi:hypothetical protein